MSMLWSQSSVKRHMHFLFVVMILISSVGFGQSQNKTEGVSRESLYQLGFDSIGFILLMAEQDKTFVKEMTAPEKRMFDGIKKLAIDITTVNWLRDQKIESFQEAGNREAYHYVISKNRVGTVAYPSEMRFRLQFSDNQEKFDLKDGKPIRSAVTAENLADNIHVNRVIINKADQPVTLGHVISILFHEFGRKFGSQMDESATDSLGGKLQKYVDSMLSTTDVPGGKVSVFKFRNAPFHEWMEAIVHGIYQGVNIPFKFSYLTLHGMPGTYIWIETEKGVQNLTKKFFEEANQKKRIAYIPDAHFKWTQINWFLADLINITVLPSGRVTIDANLNQQQLVLPFLHKSSVDPVSYQLYERAFFEDSHTGVFFQNLMEIEIEKGTAKVRKVFFKPTQFDSPRHQVEQVKKQWAGEDLILEYKVKGSKTFSVSDQKSFAVWPDLVLEFQGKKMRIRASSFDEKSEVYSFKVPNLKKANSGSVSIVGLELTAQKTNLAEPGTDFLVRTFLPSIEQIPLEGMAQSARSVLKSIQIWDGNRWSSLNHQESIKQSLKGGVVKLVFESKEKLRALSLMQRFEQRKQNSSVLYPGTDQQKQVEGPIVTDKLAAWVHFPAKALEQKLEGGVLTVYVDLDKNVDLISESLFKIPMPIPVPGAGAFISEEKVRMWVEGLRGLDVVEVVTESLQVEQVQLRWILNFQKTPVEKGSCKWLVQ